MAEHQRAALEQYQRNKDETTFSVDTDLGNTVVINGVTLEVSIAPVPEGDFNGRYWKKEERHELKKDEYAEWEKLAISFVLAKHNKLAEPEGNPGDTKYLEQIQNSKLQLNLIRAHLVKYDFIDVLTIVTPVDVVHTNQLTGDEFDLLTEYQVEYRCHCK